MKKIYAALGFLGILAGSFQNGQAQVSYPTPSQEIQRSLDSTLLTVRLDFSSSCTGITATIQFGGTDAPGQIQYIPGSLVQTGGSPGVVISEPTSISDLTNVSFNISNVTIGQFVTFTVRRRANCGTASSAKDFVTVSGSGCSFSDVNPTINSYNIKAPALSISTPPTITGANLGVPYTRTITVTNGGTGCLDTLIFSTKHSASSVITDSIKVGSTVIAPFYASTDSNLYKIPATVAYPSGQMCNTNTITVTEHFRLTACNPTTSYRTSYEDFTNVLCGSASSSATITMSNNPPNLQLASIYDSTYCVSGGTITQKVRIVNTGTGAATQILLNFVNGIPGSYSSYHAFDTSAAWNISKMDGSILGTTSSFTALASQNVYVSGCTTTLFPLNVRANLGSLVIPAGDTVVLEIKIKTTKPSCVPQCNQSLNLNLALQGGGQYKNQCGTSTINLNNAPLIQAQAALFRATLETPVTISGTAPDNAFNAVMNISLMRNVVQNGGGANNYIAIPLTGTPFVKNADTAIFSSLSGVTVKRAMTLVGDTIRISIPDNANFDLYTLTIPMRAECGTNGEYAISPYFMFRRNSCSEYGVLNNSVCMSNLIQVVCPSPCSKGGATVRNFSLRRINLGLPDNNNDFLPDASGALDMNKVKVKQAVNGDTVMGTWNIYVNGNNDPLDPNYGVAFNHTYIDVYLGPRPVGQYQTLTPLPNAEVTIYPTGGGTPIVCTVTPTVLTTAARAKYDLSTCKATWSGGDSIVVKAKYIVNNGNLPNFGNGSSALGGNQIYNFVSDNYVYSTYNPVATPITELDTNIHHTCLVWNDYLSLVGMWVSPFLPSNQVINGCNNDLVVQHAHFNGPQGSGKTIFPGEYRYFDMMDSFYVKLPPGMNYREGTLRLTSATSSSILSQVGSLYYLPSSVTITQVGDTLKVGNIKSIYTPYGGTIIPVQEYGIRFGFSVDPTCNAVAGTYPSSTYAAYTGNGINSLTNATSYYSLTTANVFIYNAPTPSLTGGSTYTSIDGNAEWTVTLQNGHPTVPASNAYLFVDSSLMNSVVITDLSTSTVLTQDANGYYQLGSLAGGFSRNYKVTASTSASCATDTLKLYFGWGCAVQSGAFTPSSCNQVRNLPVINEQSQIQLSVLSSPSTAVALCTNLSSTFSMNSALAAYSDNPQFRVLPATGMVISSGEIEYPAGSGNWQTITPTIESGYYVYNVENHTGMNVKGLPGTGTTAASAPRSANLRVNYSLGCYFVSGSRLTVVQRADRPCGDAIPSTLGYNGLVRTNPINVVGVSTTGTLNVSQTLAPSAISCGTSTLTGAITPIAAPTSAKDTVVVTFGAGSAYSGGFTSTSGATIAGSPVINSDGTSSIKIKLPSGVNPGVSIDYSYDVDVLSSASCGQIEIMAEARRSSDPSVCNGTPCPFDATSIIGETIDTITINRPDIAINSASITSGIFAPSSTINVNVSVSNASSTTGLAADNLVLNFYCGTSTTPFASETYPSAVGTNSTGSADITITLPSTFSCPSGSNIRIVAEKSDNSCICDSATFIINSAFNTVSGNVLNDGNGLTDNTVNGTGINTAATPLYVSLVSGTSIITTIPVNADGTYQINGVIDGAYNVILSYNSSGSSTPSPLTGIWQNTGDNIGSSAGDDATPNGALAITVAGSTITNINFGINKQPESGGDYTTTPQANPGGTNTLSVPSDAFGGTDAEDGSYPLGLDGVTVSIAPAVNGTLYYDGVAITTATIINGFDPTLIAVDPSDGSDTISFDYAVIDSAGFASAPSTINIPIFTMSISGTVYNDNNAGVPNGTTPPVGLVVNLLDNSGNVIGTDTLSATGTYSFNGLNAGDYQVQLNTITGTIGSTAPAQVLPTSYQNVSSTDTTPTNGTTSVTVSNANVTGVNFGINLPPTASNIYQPAQVNPGGTVSATVMPASFGGTDPNSGTIASLTITSFPENATSITVNGTVYTSSTFPSAGITVPTNAAGSPTQSILVDPIEGAVTVSIPYINTDIAGLTSDTGHAFVPFVGLSISGNIYDDNDAGIPNGDLPPTGLYINVLYADGTVAAVATVNPDGSYAVPGLSAGTYNVQINTTAGVVGNAAPSQTLPTGYYNVSSTDTIPTDGVTAVTLSSTDVTGINFGINEPPVAIGTSPAVANNPGGTLSSTIPPATFSGTDPNDGSIVSMTITEFPANATSITINTVTYTSSTFPSSGVTILTDASGSPLTTISVDPLDGDVTVEIPFYVTDEAGLISPIDTAMVPFQSISLSGNVFNDGNGMTDGFVNGIGIDSTDVPLYISLVNSVGNVIATTAVNVDGTYTFESVLNGAYNLVLHQNPIGTSIPSISTLWTNTGEHIGLSAGSDGLNNGKIAVTVAGQDVVQVNFGINKLPESFDTVTTLVGAPNPGLYPLTSPLSGLDNEDMPLGGVWSNAVVISTVPSNGFNLIYNGSLVNAGDTIPNFDIALLEVEATTSVPNGTSSTSFTYATIDSAAYADPTPATYTVLFATPLPVQLLSFDAKAQGNSAVMTSWAVAKEDGISRYEVEHSTDATHFQSIGTIEASNSSQYSLVHNSPARGANYYRLAMYEADGTTVSYSEVKMVQMNTSKAISMYPNPAKDKVTILLPELTDATVVIYGVDGRELMHTSYTATTVLELHTQTLASGVYSVMVSTTSGDRFVEQLVIKK